MDRPTRTLRLAPENLRDSTPENTKGERETGERVLEITASNLGRGYFRP